MYVISETQALFGVETSNSLFKRFSFMGKLCLESVVILNFFFCIAFNPSSFISLSIRLILSCLPSFLSFSCIRGLPYVHRLCQYISAIFILSLLFSNSLLLGFLFNQL